MLIPKKTKSSPRVRFNWLLMSCWDTYKFVWYTISSNRESLKKCLKRSMGSDFSPPRLTWCWPVKIGGGVNGMAVADITMPVQPIRHCPRTTCLWFLRHLRYRCHHWCWWRRIARASFRVDWRQAEIDSRQLRWYFTTQQILFTL